MVSNKSGVMAVTGMILVVLSVAILIPAIIINLDSPQSTTINQVENERGVVTGSITSEATNITRGGNPTVNVTLFDTNTGEVNSTGEINEGQNASIIINEQEMFIEIIDVVSQTEAIIKYSYPIYIGMPDEIGTFFDNLVLIIIISVVVMLSGVMLVVSEVYA